MTKEELLKIYSAYLLYNLTGVSIVHQNESSKLIGFSVTCRGNLVLEIERPNGITYYIAHTAFKPHLYDLSYLTKEELRDAGFTDHIDWLTDEREGWIEKYGFDEYVNKIPTGHFQYLVSNHYNIFGLPEDQYINKATLTNK